MQNRLLQNRLVRAVVVCGFWLLFGAAAQAQQTREELSRNLPASGLSNEEVQSTGRTLLAAPGFAKAKVAVNPAFPDATPVGERTCTACHQLEADHFTHTLHALGLHAANKADASIPVCETCHGPGSQHAQAPLTKGSIIAYTKNGGTPIDVQTQTCLTCHEGGPRDHWLGSIHQRNGLSCSDCHNPMAKFSVEGSLAKSSINDTCAQCHQDVRMQFNRRSHMPLPEGQMSCADCHNPHGSLTAPLLKTNTVNETCYQCHAEKRGPFLFEHPPVRESCLNCHSPHGSNQNTLLVAPIPFLCQQCHTAQRHPDNLHTMQSTGTGSNPDFRVMGRGCLTCHANIHGSNAPSGPKFHE
ncbi:DmsE family decaheme c-type cytochrome [Dokdonella sp.]|uniref:DmsE family decaheme c-type cytochrome n=1 Tax=Dokdonella sp. TaxID=2291710 RepID=UPI001B1A6901|nr:DmsE family decaheme c-type cytochrome [Dokdonella sp.]MBO9662970.1 DmsE family decaheme c-type cytochrome [Dokdonella sp.]